MTPNPVQDRIAVKNDEDLGVMSRIDALSLVLGRLDGAYVVDVGCGEGAIAKGLAAHGARVAGYDPFIQAPDPVWVEAGSGAYRLAESAADDIPEPDGAADVVVFVFSLHHVPELRLAAALQKARRMLKRDGRLCVLEPLAEGPGQDVMELYHDETAVRAVAKRALAREAAPLFAQERVIFFEERTRYADFDAFASQALLSVRYNDYTQEDILSPQVRRRFAETFARSGADFDQPVRINLFQGAQ